jgi:hypothetical protein
MANDNNANRQNQDNRPNANRQDKQPSWRKEILEPREDAKRAIEQEAKDNAQGRKQNPNRPNAQTQKSWEERQEERLLRQQEQLKSNLGKTQVIVQNVGETRELARLSIVLDKRFSYVRANMFVRLPGEYGMLALYDLQEALSGLKGVEDRLEIFGVKRYPKGSKNNKRSKNNERPKLNPETIKRFHYAKLKAFAAQGDNLVESLRALGYEGEAVSQALKEALSDYEAKLQAEREDKIAKEEAERVEKARLKAERTAKWEAKQEEIAKQKRQAKQNNASGDQGEANANDQASLDRFDDQAETPSLTAEASEAKDDQETKPSKAKKDKEKTA